ncbi:hypothetical protein BH09BAC5_BH09BAC5_18400 [soil metagenome]
METGFFVEQRILIFTSNMQMKKNKIILLIGFLTISSFLHAGKIDKTVLKNITGTKWELVSEKKSGKLFSKTNKNPSQTEITFSTGSILFDSGEKHYECNYTLKNNFEFWMYCTEPDQYIYKIHSLNSRKLEMDFYVKVNGGKYVKAKRMVFERK